MLSDKQPTRKRGDSRSDSWADELRETAHVVRDALVGASESDHANTRRLFRETGLDALQHIEAMVCQIHIQRR